METRKKSLKAQLVQGFFFGFFVIAFSMLFTKFVWPIIEGIFAKH